MKERINIASELFVKLQKGIPQHIIQRAVAENEWFSQSDIEYAIDAICEDMLMEHKLREWVAHYPTLPVTSAERVLIVMAGNIPLVGFFDLLCVFMAGHDVYVKCSSKDRVLMEYVISVILDIEPSAPIYIYDNQTPNRVIATGGESAVRHFRATYANIPTLLRGSRHSIAVLSAEGDDDMSLLANDVYMYSGLGCRNVSMIFTPKGCKVALPQVATHPKYHNNYVQNRALHIMRGKEMEDNGSSLFIASDKIPNSLSTISICEYESLAQVEGWIKEHDSQLQCIVSNVISHPRRVGFGESQRPTLYDYADEVDTMKFLM